LKGELEKRPPSPQSRLARPLSYRLYWIFNKKKNLEKMWMSWPPVVVERKKKKENITRTGRENISSTSFETKELKKKRAREHCAGGLTISIHSNRLWNSGRNLVVGDAKRHAKRGATEVLMLG